MVQASWGGCWDPVICLESDEVALLMCLFFFFFAKDQIFQDIPLTHIKRPKKVNSQRQKVGKVGVKGWGRRVGVTISIVLNINIFFNVLVLLVGFFLGVIKNLLDWIVVMAAQHSKYTTNTELYTLK